MLTGYQQGLILEQILKQCGNDLSRENIVKQAKSLKDVVLPTSMPGISINTSATSNMIWTQLQLQRWSGTNWEQFGEGARREVRVTPALARHAYGTR